MFENIDYIDDPSTLGLETTPPLTTKTCQLHCNPILTFILLGFIFLIVGMIQLITNYQQHSYSTILTPNGSKLTSPQFFTNFPKDASVGFYIHIPWLTQYNFTYTHQGKNIEEFDLSADSCIHYKTNKEIQKTISADGHILINQKNALPCGRYPSLLPGQELGVTLNGLPMTMQREDLTVFKYEVQNFDVGNQWIDLKQSFFQNWMEHNAAIRIKKLIGVIQGGFEGQLQLNFQLSENMNKHIDQIEISLSNNQALGGYNFQFCLVNITESIIMFLMALAIHLYDQINNDQIDCLSESKIQQPAKLVQSKAINQNNVD